MGQSVSRVRSLSFPKKRYDGFKIRMRSATLVNCLLLGGPRLTVRAGGFAQDGF